MWIQKVTEQLRKGLLSSSEILNSCLKLVDETRELNAFVAVTDEIAKQDAKLADERYASGASLSPLDGIPIAIKDNFNTKGVRTTCCSRMLANYTPPYSATVVTRLADSGAIMVGKTNLDEFAMGSAAVDSIFGPTKNPWKSGLKYKARCKRLTVNHYEEPHDWHISGGSSGGSAVAVATGCCYGALGSDTGGSTRNPSAHCGIVGLKPTYGLVSRHGLIPLTNSMDVPGIMARTTDDVALILNAIAGHDPYDSTTVCRKFSPVTLSEQPNIRGLHIGIPQEYNTSMLSEEIKSEWDSISNLLHDGGARVSNVSLPHTKYSIVCYSILNKCEVASNFARYDGIEFGHRGTSESSTERLYAETRHEGFGSVVRERILVGNYFLLKRNYDKYFIQALKVRRLIYQDFENVFGQGIDLLLTPLTLTTAPTYTDWMKKSNKEKLADVDFCTQPVNMAGLPAISVPCNLSDRGLPIGLQLIGKAFADEQVLNAAKWIEQQVDFPTWELNM